MNFEDGELFWALCVGELGCVCRFDCIELGAVGLLGGRERCGVGGVHGNHRAICASGINVISVAMTSGRPM
jgi:hypothetical protein